MALGDDEADNALSVDPERGDVLEAATQKLAELSEKYLGGTAQVLLVTKENPEISLD